MRNTARHPNPSQEHDLPSVSWQASLRRWWDRAEWIMIASAWVAALALGYAGFFKYATSTGVPHTPWDLIYLTLQLIPMNSGAVPGPVSWELNIARLLIPLLTAFTAVQAFAALFRQQADLVRLRFIHDHIVICGLSHKGLLLTNGFRDRREQVVVIEQNGQNNLIEQCRLRGAIVLVGDAKEKENLRKAAAARARAVIAVCEDDSVNAEIALSTREVVQGRAGTPLTCIIHVFDPQLSSLLRELEIEMEAGSAFRLELFNVYNVGAQLLLKDMPLFKNNSEAQHHLVVIGLGMMGESLVANAARLWRERYGKANHSLRITVVDLEANKKTDALRARYPRLRECCELVACDIDVHSAEFQHGDFLSNAHELAEVDTFCICLDDDALSLYTGLALQQLTRQYEIPIIVRIAESTGLARLLSSHPGEKKAYRNLHTFSLLNRTCTPDLLLGGTHEVLAKAIYEEYLRSQPLPVDAPDVVQAPSWEALPESIKETNRHQADHIGMKLSAVSCGIAPLTDWDAPSFEFSPGEIERMAQLEHENWMEHLLADGWTYQPGEKKPGAKSHPDLLPWAELPENEKEKNRNTVREIPRFLAHAGFQVERQLRIE